MHMYSAMKIVILHVTFNINQSYSCKIYRPFSFFCMGTGPHTKALGHHLRFIQLQASVDVYLHSFLPSTIRLWNSLPANVVSSLTIDNFKNKLTSIN